MVLYHETIDANLQLQSDQMPVKDTPEFRLRVLQGFQGVLWSANPEHRLLITINKTPMKFIDIEYLIFSIRKPTIPIDYVEHF